MRVGVCRGPVRVSKLWSCEDGHVKVLQGWAC